MTGDSQENNKLSHFFSRNSGQIDEPISFYSKYNERILKTQIEGIAELMVLVKARTNDDKWWNWKGWDLGYDSFNHQTTMPRIGLESSY